LIEADGFDLWGFTPLRLLEYGIFSSSEPIWVQLEVKFVTGLEGNADVSFSRDPGPGGSVLLGTFRWTLQGM